MPFQKGTSGNPRGRQKGQPNKLTGALKDMVLAALDGAGGVEYLKAQAKKNPTAFLTLVGKVLPLQVTGAEGTPLIPSSGIVFNVQMLKDADNRT